MDIKRGVHLIFRDRDRYTYSYNSYIYKSEVDLCALDSLDHIYFQWSAHDSYSVRFVSHD